MRSAAAVRAVRAKKVLWRLGCCDCQHQHQHQHRRLLLLLLLLLLRRRPVATVAEAAKQLSN